MKSNFLFFCIILILFSCSSNIKNDLHDEKSTLLAKSNIIIDTNKDHEVNDTIRKGISKANKSIEFITIDQLDIATKDLGFFDSKLNKTRDVNNICSTAFLRYVVLFQV
jgi:hypothetical protein